MITLMYITNNTKIAQIADRAGVDRVWVDLETLGKEERQAGMNTVKSKHSIEDICRIKPLLKNAKMMVRVNPLNPNSEDEINKVVEAGADYIMLPMYRDKEDVETFLKLVDARAKTMLLLETIDAQKNLDEYIDLPGIDEIHIGLNDLHLQYKLDFMFELLANGTVASITEKIKAKGIRFGFGGFARVGYGILPAEMILTDHYALGSQMAILSRGFCDANIVEEPETVADIFVKGVQDIREKEKEVSGYTEEQYAENHEAVKEKVAQIVAIIREKK
jgi:2-keto-3-deoxy-L-rhamnonate aldolase RhmA